jgi:hypothetical protein
MKNVVFSDIKTQFVPHRRHITSLLQDPVFRNVTPCAFVRTDVSEEFIAAVIRSLGII